MKAMDHLHRLVKLGAWPAACVVAIIILKDEPDLLKDWAWPVVVIVGVVLLRREIASLIGRLEVFAGPAGIKAEFSKKIASLSQTAEDLVPNVPDKIPVPSRILEHDSPTRQDVAPSFTDRLEIQDELLAQVDIDPRNAIYRAWQVLERITFHASCEYKTPLTPELLTTLLVSQQAIDPEFSRIASELRFAKDAASMWHIQVNPQDAGRIVSSAWRLAAVLEAALKESGLRFPSMLQQLARDRENGHSASVALDNADSFSEEAIEARHSVAL